MQCTSYMNLACITGRCNACIPKSYVVCGLINLYSRRVAEIVPVQQTYHSLMQKPTKTCKAVAVTGAAALVLGIVLIIFAHYHERAYIFIVLGAGGLIGGLAGIIVVGQKVRVVLDYGLIAMGIVAMVVGFNYVIGVYDTEPSLVHGYPVIALSSIAILIGTLRELIAQPCLGCAGFWSVIVLGVLGSLGIAMAIVGLIYLTMLNVYDKSFLFLALGVAFLGAGIIGGIFVQRRANHS